MKTIVFPTDFSSNARQAIQYGLSLFGKVAEKVILLHSSYIHYTFLEVPALVTDAESEKAAENLQKELDLVLETHPELKGKVETLYALGEVHEVVREVEKDGSVDLVVMGTKGASNAIDKLVGSHTSHLIGNITSPVIVVPENAILAPPANILITADYQSSIEKSELQPIYYLIENYESDLRVLHVELEGESLSSHEEYLKSKLEFNLLKAEPEFETINGENVDETLDSYIKTHQVDMLFMVTHRGNLFQQLFHRSITRKLSLHSNIPIYILHHEI